MSEKQAQIDEIRSQMADNGSDSRRKFAGIERKFERNNGIYATRAAHQDLENAI